MSRNIESLVKKAYHFQISKITDKIIPEIRAWQNRPLENIYPVIFINDVRYKIKEYNVFVTSQFMLLLVQVWKNIKKS